MKIKHSLYRAESFFIIFFPFFYICKLYVHICVCDILQSTQRQNLSCIKNKNSKAYQECKLQRRPKSYLVNSVDGAIRKDSSSVIRCMKCNSDECMVSVTRLNSQ